MDATNHPDVKSYLDANQFLRDVYSFRKSNAVNGENFSYEIWARQIGLTSKSYLRFAVLGKRGISAVLAQKISDSLKLEGCDKEYFSLLVLYTQCKDKEQKNILGRKLTELLRSPVQMSEIDPFETVLSNPLMIAVRNLLSFSDIPRTIDFIQKILELENDEVKNILQVLSQQGLIVEKQGEWLSTNQDIKVSDKSKGETLLYHKRCLLRAIQAQEQPQQERHFRSLGIALTKEQYADYLNNLDRFIQNIFFDYNNDHFSEKRLYQVNFNLYPWTVELEKLQK
ncbi:MAG: TIGR02147 family protein [Bdellovibrionota bacterium]